MPLYRIVKYRSRQRRIGAPLDEHIQKCLGLVRAAGSDHRHAHRARKLPPLSARSNPLRVPSRSIEVSKISPAPRDAPSLRPCNRILPVESRPPRTNASQ